MLAEPEIKEKRMAALMHVATIPAPIIAPVVTLAISRKDSFLRAHAVKSLKETIILNVILGVLMICSFAYSLSRLWALYQADWQGFSITEFLIRFVIGWILLMIIAAFNFVGALKAAHSAYAGTWPKSSRKLLEQGDRP